MSTVKEIWNYLEELYLAKKTNLNWLLTLFRKYSGVGRTTKFCTNIIQTPNRWGCEQDAEVMGPTSSVYLFKEFAIRVYSCTSISDRYFCSWLYQKKNWILWCLEELRIQLWTRSYEHCLDPFLPCKGQQKRTTKSLPLSLAEQTFSLCSLIMRGHCH